ncbi:MAG: acylphosphatase [Gammaproteobacteria bacterium 39-13]|nr:acylphosphatase [Gammaproteobacteria bacterium]OJV86162.1 MAG: acylphosphatase [Gammaproteobacteria bacterium 39-13]
MKICKRAVVSGRVQGVFFRHATQQQALALGIKGWVRNLPSGEVECLLCGEEEMVEKLCAWLHQGPPAANVAQVKIESTAWEEHEDFTILR